MNRLRPKIARSLYRLAMRVYPHLEADKSLARQVDKVLTSAVLEKRFNEANTGEETPSVIIVKGYDKP